MKKLLMISLGIMVAWSSNAEAKKTAAELLAKGTPEEQGEAIALEADERDIGWNDMEMMIEMVLKQPSGKSISRSQRIKILQNPGREVGDKSLITFDSPADVKGTAFLSYAKILEADDQWLYLPALKRIKRISSNNKSGPFVGSEFAYEDITSAEIGKYKWKYLGTVDCGPGLRCFKLETIPKYEHSGYTKRIVFMDTEHFRVYKTDFYDRKGDLLKTQTNTGYKQYLGKFWRADKWEMVNYQNGKSTILNNKEYKFKQGLTDRNFTRAVLKRAK